MSLQVPENASPVRINQLTVASVVNPTDITVIVQNGVTKQATADLFSNAVVAGTQTANATLSAIAAMSATVGMMTFLGLGNVSAVTLTGTAGEITVTNGQGSGAPTFSLPTTLVFTGKTVSAGTFQSPTINNGTLTTPTINGGTISGATISFSSLNVSGNATIGGNLTVSGNSDISGNDVIHGDLTVSGAVSLPNFLSNTAAAALAANASAGTSTVAARSDHQHQIALEELIVAASDETTVLSTGTAKITFTTTLARLLTSVQANLTTANSASVVSGPLTVDVNMSGQSIFGANKLVVSNGSTTSRTATTQPTFSATVVPANSVWTIDIDNTGSAVSATGLKVTFIWRQNT